MNKYVNLSVFFIMSLSSLKAQQLSTEDVNKATNPFFKEYKTPFGVPPFNLIKNEHFLEAFTKGIAEHKNEIQLIVSNNETPTFQNTIMALENSGKLLNKVSTVFYNINSANTSEEIQGIAQKLAPVTSAHQDEITLNLDLFNRVKQVWDYKKKLKLIFIVSVHSRLL